MASHAFAGSFCDGHIAAFKELRGKQGEEWEVQEKLFTKEAQSNQFSQGKVKKWLTACLGVAACGGDC